MRRDIWSAAQSISTIEFDKPNKRFVDISDDFEPMDE